MSTEPIFLSWQRGGSPNPVSAADLAIWQADYGAVVLSSTATTAAVPEPLHACPRTANTSSAARVGVDIANLVTS